MKKLICVLLLCFWANVGVFSQDLPTQYYFENETDKSLYEKYNGSLFYGNTQYKIARFLVTDRYIYLYDDQKGMLLILDSKSKLMVYKKKIRTKVFHVNFYTSGDAVYLYNTDYRGEILEITKGDNITMQWLKYNKNHVFDFRVFNWQTKRIEASHYPSPKDSLIASVIAYEGDKADTIYTLRVTSSGMGEKTMSSISSLDVRLLGNTIYMLDNINFRLVTYNLASKKLNETNLIKEAKVSLNYGRHTAFLHNSGTKMYLHTVKGDSYFYEIIDNEQAIMLNHIMSAEGIYPNQQTQIKGNSLFVLFAINRAEKYSDRKFYLYELKIK